MNTPRKRQMTSTNKRVGFAALLLALLALALPCLAQTGPNPPTNNVCRPERVDIHTNTFSFSAEADAGGPYALSGSNVEINVSGRVINLSNGWHQVIEYYTCSHTDHPAPPIHDPYAVVPEKYTYSWWISPTPIGIPEKWSGNGNTNSFSDTAYVFTAGVYSVKADFVGTRPKCQICTFSTNNTAEFTVYQLIATNTPWLGLDRRDEGLTNKIGGGEAFLTPPDPATYKWELKSEGYAPVVCTLEEPTYEPTVKYKTTDKEKCSKNFLDQKLEVTATITSPEPFSLSATTNFTVVKVDVTVGDSDEATEEVKGEWVPYIADTSTNILSEAATGSMVRVSITCTPANLPYGEVVTIDVPPEFLYEKKENGVYQLALSSYEASEISAKQFYVHGHATNKFQILVIHPTSQAKDVAKVRVSDNPFEEECEACASCSGDRTTVENMSIYFAQSFGRTPWVAGAPSGIFRVHEKISTDRLGSPAMFKYDHPLSRKVLSRNDSIGYIAIIDSQGHQVSYMNGSPAEESSGKDMQCVIGADGLVTETLPDRTRVVYGADKAVLKLITPEGVEVTAADLGINVIKNTDGIRQVWSKTDGLLDVVCPPYSHETVVSWYPPAAVSQQPDASGLYTFTGNPAKTFTFSRTSQAYYKWVSGPECPICAAGINPYIPCACGSTYVLSGLTYGLTLDERRGTEFLFHYEWKFDRYDNDWTLTKGSGDDFVKDRLIHIRTPGTSTVTRVRSDASGRISTHEKKVYLNDRYGAKLIRRYTVESDGSERLGYSAERIGSGNLAGRLSATASEYGASTSYEHDGYGRIISESTTVAGGIAQVTGYGYPEAPDAQGFVDHRPTGVVVYQNGVLTSCTDYSYKGAFAVNGSGVLGLCDTVTRRDPTNGVSLKSYTHYYSATSANAIERGRVRLKANPDGTATHYAYAAGDNGSWTETVTQGYFDISVQGASSLEQLFNVLPGKSTRTVSMHDFRGDVVRSETHVHTGSGFTLAGWETYAYNIMHKQLGTTRHDGTSEMSNWICTGPVWQRNADGTSVTNTFDTAKRIKTSTRYTPFGNVATTYTYDADDRVVSQTTATNGVTLGCGIGCGATYSEFDAQGLTILAVDTIGGTNKTSYSLDNRTVTHIDPAGAVVVENYATDGSLLSRTGNVMRAEYYTQGVDSATGTRWDKTTYGSPTGADYSKSYYNALGQLVLQERPGFGGATLKTVYVYNAKGQLESQSQTVQGGTGTYDLPVTTYAYNQLGASLVTTQAVANVYRIQSSHRAFVVENGIVQQISISVQSCSDATIPAMTNATVTRLYPLTNGVLSEMCQRDVRGNETVQKVVQNSETYIRTTTVSNATSVLPAISLSLADLTLSSTDQHGCITTYGYDALMRQISAESSSGPNNERLTGTYTHYNVIGQVECTEDAFGARTVYGYEPGTGRNISTTQVPPPSSLLSPTSVQTAFDQAGRTVATWGATYPVAYEYDAAGRMIAMYTYRGTNEINSYSQITNLKSEMDRTRWLYDEATGLLTNKIYADGKGPSYDYTALGQLATRAWARTDSTGQQLLTRYKYDNFDSLTNTAYSDGTPSVSFTYDGIGRQKVAQTFLSVTGEIISCTTNIYEGFDLVAEIQNGVHIEKPVDALGRTKGLAIGEDYVVEYGFNDYGQFSYVKSVSGSGRMVTNIFTYSYLRGSHLIASVDHPSFSARKTYEPDRDLITTVSNTFGTVTISAFNYENDAFGRRTARVDITPNLTVNNSFSYNLKSEVTTATMANGDSSYDYDPIGNRVHSTVAVGSGQSETNTYLANALNQYSSLQPKDLQPINLSYDLDGNMLTNGVWSYTWDAENRLLSACSNGVLLIANRYDDQSRRIVKSVFEITQSGTNVLRQSTFAYDGWNPAREVTVHGSGGSTNYYCWGSDLSGTLQGAGGVGGLQAIIVDGETPACYYPCYDANGNITTYVDKLGLVRAEYAYDAFGKTISQSGDLATTFTHRFSTKYGDGETGQYYYGYRFYLPELGRWVNRDYIMETIMDNNLYCSVKNGLINKTDYLGLTTIEDSKTVTDDVTSLTDAGLLVDTYYIYKSLQYGFYTETPLLQLKVSVAIDASLNKSIPNVPSTKKMLGSDAKVPAFIGAWMNIDVIVLDQKALNCFCGMKEGQTANVGWRQFKYSFPPAPAIGPDDNETDGWYSAGSSLVDVPGQTILHSADTSDRQFKDYLYCRNADKGDSKDNKYILNFNWSIKHRYNFGKNGKRKYTSTLSWTSMIESKGI